MNTSNLFRGDESKAKELSKTYSRLATPSMKNVYVMARRNGDTRSEPVSCVGYDLSSVREDPFQQSDV